MSSAPSTSGRGAVPVLRGRGGPGRNQGRKPADPSVKKSQFKATLFGDSVTSLDAFMNDSNARQLMYRASNKKTGKLEKSDLIQALFSGACRSYVYRAICDSLARCDPLMHDVQCFVSSLSLVRSLKGEPAAAPQPSLPDHLDPAFIDR